MTLITLATSHLRRGTRQWAVLLQQHQQLLWQQHQQQLLPSHRNTHSKTSDVPLTFPSVCIWGANTNVGKTLVSAGLVAAAVRNKVSSCCCCYGCGVVRQHTILNTSNRNTCEPNTDCNMPTVC
jgi:hypothetical protein